MLRAPSAAAISRCKRRLVSGPVATIVTVAPSSSSASLLRGRTVMRGSAAIASATSRENSTRSTASACPAGTALASAPAAAPIPRAASPASAATAPCLALALQRIRAHQFGEIRRLVRLRRAYRPHLVQIDVASSPRRLQRRFRPRQSAADNFKVWLTLHQDSARQSSR